MDLLVKNGVLCDANGRLRADLYIRDGLIEAVGRELAVPAGCPVLDAGGKTVLPAFVDLHCHFRDPGYTQKEDIATGSRAAAAGGYTAVNCMANTDPVCSSMEGVHYAMERARAVGLVDLHQCVSVTEHFDGETTEHLKALTAEVRCISEDGRGVARAAVMERAMRIAREKGMAVLSHAEEMEISPYDYRLAENLATVRDIALAAHTGAHLHLCHVSTREAMAAIAAAKGAGVWVTCEVAPHHLYFKDSGYRVNPPIRQGADVEALIQACLKGEVDAIATDHAPHTEADKAAGSPGMVGLETAFSVCHTVLCRENGLPLEALSRMMSQAPAQLLGMNKGLLRPGFDGDLALVDEAAPHRAEAAKLHSKSKNTPFDGKTFTGRVECTVKAGRVTYTRDGK